MSINTLLHPNNYTVYDKNHVIGTLEIIGDSVNQSVTSTQIYNACVNTGSGFVIGPEVSQPSGLVVFDGTSGTIIDNPPFTPVDNSLLGYITAPAVTNITIGTGLNITDGVLTNTGVGSGNVSFVGSSVLAQTPAMYSDTSGFAIDKSNINPDPDTLIGYDDLGNMSNIVAGSNITISGGIISASGGGGGGGNVTGPLSAFDNGLVLFDGTSGELIKNPVFTPTNNSLLGYSTSHAVQNVTVGTGLNLTGNTLTATGTGSGDVTGPNSSVAETPAIYASTTGKVLKQSNVLTTPNSIIGYDNAQHMATISVGSGLSLNSNILSISNKSYCKVSSLTPQNFNNSVGNILVLYSTTNYINNMGTVASDRVVINAAGLYNITTSININHNSGSGAFMIYCSWNGIKLDSAVTPYGYYNGQSNLGQVITTSVYQVCNPGDVIGAVVNNNSAVANISSTAFVLTVSPCF
jgi:hypothetical protein